MKKSKNDYVKVEAITLNGVSMADAIIMVNTFKKSNTRKPPMTSIWFSSEMITNMVSLLNDEQLAGLPVDGVRIYFARNKKGKNTVVLVSTYESIDPQSGKIFHQDYFEHNTETPLFKDGHDKYFLQGEICTNNSCDNGARLYEKNTNYDDDKNCPRNSNHYISMQYATEMVWNFGNTTVNTSCEWFDLGMFASYLTGRFNGIRIYFGKRSNVDPLYPSLDGFVVVTTEDITINDIRIPRRDYFDCNEDKLHNSQDNGEQCQPNCLGTSLGGGN